VLPTADRDALRAALTFPGVRRGPNAELGPLWLSDWGYTVRPVALDARPGFQVGAALFDPEGPYGDTAVLVANGHFDLGKSGPETQQIAHRLAARGIPVLVVDNPGMEEWGSRDRALHFGRGAHNRAWLQAGGSSALALQLAGLQAGLDFLDERGMDRVVATGASGGAVLSFWLSVLDQRVSGVVLASAPDVPRVPAEGCDCKQLPGFVGPDPSVARALSVPSLWLIEEPRPRLEGLPDTAVWQVVQGEHSYTETMQRDAVAWIERHFERDPGSVWVDPPLKELHTSPHAGGRTHLSLFDLPLAPSTTWTPTPVAGLQTGLRCTGAGPVVLSLGGPEALDDFEVCTLTLPESTFQTDAGRGVVYADRVAGALAGAFDSRDALAVWGAEGHAVAVAGCGRPHVLQSPRLSVQEVALDTDPPWMHVPGLWWGLTDTLYADSVATSDDPEVLVLALRQLAGLR
jgi:dienelactone hydrolase